MQRSHHERAKRRSSSRHAVQVSSFANTIIAASGSTLRTTIHEATVCREDRPATMTAAMPNGTAAANFQSASVSGVLSSIMTSLSAHSVITLQTNQAATIAPSEASCFFMAFVVLALATRERLDVQP